VSWWNTFLGPTAGSEGSEVVVDHTGSVIMAGTSYASWGNPVDPFLGTSANVMLVKLSSDGELLWNTFYSRDENYPTEPIAVTVDSEDNVYVLSVAGASCGSSCSTSNVILGKFDVHGNPLWSLLVTPDSGPRHSGLAIDATGNVYIAAYAYSDSWGTTVRPYSDGGDGFVAKIDVNGVVEWNTFLGSSAWDISTNIALDNAGNLIVVGASDGTWGDPVYPHSGNNDVYIASLDGAGNLVWNTFLGSSNYLGEGAAVTDVAIDVNGNILLCGTSVASWGTPKNPFTGSINAFVAKLNSDGVYQWNTFLGNHGTIGIAIAADAEQDLYVAGTSETSWGDPLIPFAEAGQRDAYTAKVSSDGDLIWNLFLGSRSYDYGTDIAVGAIDQLRVTGTSYENWGMPIQPFSGEWKNAFLAGITINQLKYSYLPVVSRQYAIYIPPGIYPTNRCAEKQLYVRGIHVGLLKECVPDVEVRANGFMQFNFTWTIDYVDGVDEITKYADTYNANMYVTDDLSTRYNHVAVGGAAAEDVVIEDSVPAYGWFLFIPGQEDAGTFAFHDDDQQLLIEGIGLAP